MYITKGESLIQNSRTETYFQSYKPDTIRKKKRFVMTDENQRVAVEVEDLVSESAAAEAVVEWSASLTPGQSRQRQSWSFWTR